MPQDDPSKQDELRPVLGFVLFGGSLSGALVRDVRLANELSRRGYPVHVWWAMDWQKTAGLAPNIQQHWLFHGLRFWGPIAPAATEVIGKGLNLWFDDKARAHGAQRRPHMLNRMMENLTRCVCDGADRQTAIVSRFARELEMHRVTHVLPMLEFLCPWVAAARRKMNHSVRYLVTFQGYELYSTYARTIGREQDLYDRLVETVRESDWPAIAVSEDYKHRVMEELGVPENLLCAIPPGVPSAQRMEPARAAELVKSRFAEYRSGVPLIAYLGRRDTEKGIDLLLYAAAILRQRGYDFQLAICGPSLWGDHYSRMCQKIAEELRCPVMWRRFVPDDVRTALFSIAHCVIYPSIHREPFGMVAAEVVAHGTPVIVPDYGGVASAIEANGEVAGLRFKVWDSGDLADQIAKLLDDRELHRRLADAGPRVAEYFSIESLGDRVLDHIGLSRRLRH
jgi:glycosyltransferase involved in cell wall biosynthesis